MRKIGVLVGFMILIISATRGQQRTLTTLQGRILDDSTGESLGFATISYPHLGINSMSSAEGRFIIKIGNANPGDSLMITHIGYKALYIPVTPGPTGGLTLRLQRQPIQLSDVIVSGISPLDIIRKAIRKIPDNYPVTPYQLSGFYRLTSRANSSIIEVSEAIFEIYGSDYSTRSQQFNLIRSRIDQDRNAFGWNNIFQVRRPEGVIAGDLVGRIHQSEILGDKEMAAHEFSYQGIIDYEGRPAYKIDFDQREDIQKAYHRGTIIIDTGNFAFLSIARALSPRGIQYWQVKTRREQDVLDRVEMKQTMFSDSVTVTYRPYGTRYFLHHYYRRTARRLTGGHVRQIDLNPITTETNYLVTRVDTADVHPFFAKDLLPKDAAIEFREMPNNKRPNPFWESYNLIEADYNVDSAASVIHRHNRLTPP
jgi:hypothetical protein